MPSIPKQPTPLENLNAVDVLNRVREDLGGTYADVVPQAVKPGDTTPNGTQYSDAEALGVLRSIGQALDTYRPMANQFINALGNRIGMVYITSRLYRNPLAGFKKGMLEYGETIEEIFVGMAKPFDFKPFDETSPFKTAANDVKAYFHTMNYQKEYEASVSNDMLRQAFLSWQGITDLISKIIEQIYTGANYDEFITFKYMIARAALDGRIATNTIPAVTADNARGITSTMVEQALDLTYMSNQFTEAGNTIYTDPSYLYILLTNKVRSIFDVEVLALSFNMNKAELIGRQVGIDNFTIWDNKRLAILFPNFQPFTAAEIEKLSTIQALMVDWNWFQVYDNYINMTEIYNPRNLIWNYFYHDWKTFSISPFSNAVLFTTTTSSITAVTITSPVTSAVKGGQVQLTDTVTGTGFVNQSVVWTVSGGTDSSIDTYGILTIGKNETATTLTITATSIADPSVSGTTTITVSGN